MKGSQNQRAYPDSTRGWGSFLITLGHWFDDKAFGYSIIDSKSLSHVAFLPWRDGASYTQGTTTASDRCKRSHRVARYPHQVLMVKVECRNWLTIHIPRSRVTDDISIKNEALSPGTRIAAADLVARSPLQFNATSSKEILLGSKHDWAHSRRLVDRRLPALGWIKALTPPFKPGGVQVILRCLQGSLPTSLLVSCFRTRIKFTRPRWMCILLDYIRLD